MDGEDNKEKRREKENQEKKENRKKGKAGNPETTRKNKQISSNKKRKGY